jgi:hypothetical protein
VQGFDLAKPGFAPALRTEVEPRARQLSTLHRRLPVVRRGGQQR